MHIHIPHRRKWKPVIRLSAYTSIIHWWILVTCCAAFFLTGVSICPDPRFSTGFAIAALTALKHIVTMAAGMTAIKYKTNTQPLLLIFCEWQINYGQKSAIIGMIAFVAICPFLVAYCTCPLSTAV